MTEPETDTVTVSTRITKPMFKGVQTILTANSHLNIADYVRDLIRKDLENRSIGRPHHALGADIGNPRRASALAGQKASK